MKWAQLWDGILPRQIIIYADFIDPFCYIGFHNARRAAEAARVPLRWRGFELNPETPKEGSLLETAANSDLRPGMWASVRDFARKSGLTLNDPGYVPNTRLAHRWVQSIKNQDVKNSLIERIYQAYLSDKKDIGNPLLLSGLAMEFAQSSDTLHKAEDQDDDTSMEEFRRQALARKFPGMPGFVYRGKTYFGALSEDAWNTLLKNN